MRRLRVKKIAINSLFASSAILAAGQAFSYEDNPNYGEFSLKKLPVSIEHHGKIAAQLNAFDSERKNYGDVLVRDARYGLTLKAGKVTQADIEVGFSNYRGVAPQGNALGAIDAITVRKATVDFKILDTKTHSAGGYQTTLTLGRNRPGGADGYGVDATSTPNGYDFMDGIFLSQGMEFHGGLNANILLGVGNSLAVFNQYDTEIHSLSKAIITKSLTLKKAFIAGVDVSKEMGPGALNLKLYGAIMNDAPNSLTSEFYAGKPNVDYPGGFKVDNVQNLMHLEGSLGWDHDKWITAGVFGEFSTIDDTRKVKDDGSEKSGKYAYGPTIGKKITFMNVGFGVRGNTSKFMHSLLESGDTLTYGLAYVYKNAKNIFNKDTPTYNDETRNQITAGIGYQAASGMTLEFNWMTEKATGDNNKLFRNDKGQGGKDGKDMRHKAYLKATYEF